MMMMSIIELDAIVDVKEAYAAVRNELLIPFIKGELLMMMVMSVMVMMMTVMMVLIIIIIIVITLLLHHHHHHLYHHHAPPFYFLRDVVSFPHTAYF